MRVTARDLITVKIALDQSDDLMACGAAENKEIVKQNKDLRALLEKLQKHRLISR